MNPTRRTFLRASALLPIGAGGTAAASLVPFGANPELADLLTRLYEARARAEDAYALALTLGEQRRQTALPEDCRALLDFENNLCNEAGRAIIDAEEEIVMAIRARGERPGSGRAAIVGDRMIVDVREYLCCDEGNPDSNILEIPLADVAGLPADLAPAEPRTPHPTPAPVEAIIPGDAGTEQTGPLSFRRVRVYSPATWRATPPDDRPEGTIKAGSDGTRLAIEDIPRWEVPEVTNRPQPQPIMAEVGAGAGGFETIERRWLAKDVRHCRLCARCTMSMWVGPMVECTVDVREGLLPADQDEADRAARLWSMRHDGPLPETGR